MSNLLSGLSDALAETVRSAGLSVIRVEGRRRLPASGVVWSADGVIVTNHHVVDRDEQIGLGLPDGETVPATLVGRDPSTDLAVLRTQAKSLSPAAWDDGADLQVGHLVLALGRPGRSVQATLGIVSALGDEWRAPTGGRLSRYMQTDVVMYPGFSGGPLVATTKGAARVLGLNTSALLRGVSLTLPVATIRQVVDTLLAHGRVRRGYLGVGAQPVRLPPAVSEQIGQETGLLIVSVDAGTPAERGGLLLGDTLISLDDQPIRQMDDLLSLLSGDRVGLTMAVRLLRGGQIQQLPITVGERP